MALVLAAVVGGLAVTAIYANQGEIVRKLEQTAPDGQPQPAKNRPLNDYERRLAYNLQHYQENGLTVGAATENDPSIRTNFAAIRSRDRYGVSPDITCKALQVAKTIAVQNTWDNMLKPQQERVCQPSNSNGIVSLNFLTDNALARSYVFGHALRPPGTTEVFQVTKQEMGPIDPNQTLWLRDPYNIANPYMSMNRSRDPETNMLRDPSVPDKRDTLHLLPKRYKRPRGINQDQKKQVRFGVPAPAWPN